MPSLRSLKLGDFGDYRTELGEMTLGTQSGLFQLIDLPTLADSSRLSVTILQCNLSFGSRPGGSCEFNVGLLSTRLQGLSPRCTQRGALELPHRRGRGRVCDRDVMQVGGWVPSGVGWKRWKCFAFLDVIAVIVTRIKWLQEPLGQWDRYVLQKDILLQGQTA